MRTIRIIAVSAGLVVMGAGFGSFWAGRAVTAQTTGSIQKDYLSASKGRFSGAVVVHLPGAKMIYVSGHTGRGEDLKTQAIAAYEGIVRELAGAGAKPEDVVKLNTYIANYTPEDRAAYEDAKRRSFPADDMPASTMVGVQSLISPQNRIEVEAIAVIKGQ